jgi:carbamoyl-phosphate synthase large subunit
MTGGGAPGAAGILHCLREEPSFRITTADADPNAVTRYLADDFVQIPFAKQPAFTDELLAVCKEKEIDILLPLVTKELLPLTSRALDFESAGTKLVASPHASLEIANNKSRLYEFMDWRGMPVPAYKIIATVDQFVAAVHELGYPEKQVCFKPSVSNGSRGFRIINDNVNELDILLNHKPDSTYITLDRAVRILSGGSFPEILVSEYLPGEEFSVDCLANHGEPVLIVPRSRQRLVNGISVQGEFIEEKSIIEYCRKILLELKLHGNIGIQVKASSSGQYLILEINPRVQGSISAAKGAGINLPVLAVKQEAGLPISPSERQVKWGTRFKRYWSEVFF